MFFDDQSFVFRGDPCKDFDFVVKEVRSSFYKVVINRINQMIFVFELKVTHLFSGFTKLSISIS